MTGGPTYSDVPPRVAVIGGGLAGLSAAIRLAERGVAVDLFEARPRLGGATHSFERGGLTVDNGQHVFLRCYTAYRGLLQRMGVSDRVRIQDRFDVPVFTADGRRTRLARTNLPAPLHLGSALAGYAALSPGDRLRATRAALSLGRLDPDDPALDGRGFGAWLAEHGQSEQAVRALWELFIVAALNAPAEESSAALAAKVLKKGLLSGRDAADIGFPAVPLERLHAGPAARLLQQLGGRVHTRCKVTSLRQVDGGFEVATGPHDVDGVRAGTSCRSRAPADAVVLAVPHEAATGLLPRGALPGGEDLAELGSSPIINVHVVFDRPVTRLPFAAALDSPAQWMFDRSRVAGLDAGQYLTASVSAADAYIDTPTRELRARFLPEFRRFFPEARDAEIADFFVTRERKATFRQSPGSRKSRPPATTRTPGLLIAGAWTDTGWPDTMEGAVRSGLVAARCAHDYLFRPLERRQPAGHERSARWEQGWPETRGQDRKREVMA